MLLERSGATLLVLLLAAAWTRGSEKGRVPAGDWGGDHVRMAVTSDGGVIELDCAHGAVEETLAHDGEGRFDARGVYVQERGGPVRKDEAEDRRPVRYQGTTDGERMTLRIVFEGDADALGPFELARGKRGRVVKCK